MCEYCENNKSISKSHKVILGTQTVTTYGYMGLAKYGNDHHIRVRMMLDKENIELFDVKLKYCPFCGKKLFKDPIFPELTQESAVEIYKDPKSGPAIGFWIKEESRYLAVDNRDHNYFAKDFSTKEECLKWLAARA